MLVKEKEKEKTEKEQENEKEKGKMKENKEKEKELAGLFSFPLLFFILLPSDACSVLRISIMGHPQSCPYMNI